VFATANTKGQGGDNSERFAGTTILNEAFLERFRITIEQDYPPIAVEKKIVKAIMRECDAVDDVYADALCKWADIIRKSYRDGATTEMISTRRLEHIVHAFGIFKDRVEAIRYCVARFPADVRDAFLSLYEKIDATVVVKQAEPEVTPAPATTSAKVNAEIPATTTPTSVDSLMAEIKAMMDNAVNQSNGASYALNA
jgi:MoxR-like ATPase